MRTLRRRRLADRGHAHELAPVARRHRARVDEEEVAVRERELLHRAEQPRRSAARPRLRLAEDVDLRVRRTHGARVDDRPADDARDVDLVVAGGDQLRTRARSASPLIRFDSSMYATSASLLIIRSRQISSDASSSSQLRAFAASSESAAAGKSRR